MLEKDIDSICAVAVRNLGSQAWRACVGWEGEHTSVDFGKPLGPHQPPVLCSRLFCLGFVMTMGDRGDLSWPFS